MEPWYKVVTPRKEVREGRSFNPDEFAIALEQVVAGTAPEDYRDAKQFFTRTVFTRALKEHTGMVLRRLSGITQNSAPVLTLITQFGGGKTHTLTVLYHLIKTGSKAEDFPGVKEVLSEASLPGIPDGKVAVFVGNAWDPKEGLENPWLDIAYQLAGKEGIAALGESAKTIPPGTEALNRLFSVAGGGVLILFDEVLNFMNRHRNMADPFYAFIQNLTVSLTGTTNCSAVISLPRSQVEMTDWDIQWQDRITKVVRRVAKDLIVLDEAEISEVVRRRLFEDIGAERIRKSIAKQFAKWCFERRAQLPPEWTLVDSATTEQHAIDYLQKRFETSYPFHPATLTVFQRKWAALPQYQQTRGTLAMFAQWISIAYASGFVKARREPLITLGSAPLENPEFRSIVLGQLGESRLIPAIEADIAGEQSHARTLDVDTRGPLKEIHKRVGATILFESSGGQVDKIAHLPEIRFALIEPGIDTTSIDNAAFTLESRSFFIRKIGADGFQIRHKPTLKKVVHDRRASLDVEKEIIPYMKSLIQKEFQKNANVPIFFFPEDSASIPDTPRLTLVVIDPLQEWNGEINIKDKIKEFTLKRGESQRLYPAALIWCLKKPSRELRERVETLLAWKRIQNEVNEGILGADFDKDEIMEIQRHIKEAQDSAKDEVWAEYRFVIIYDPREENLLKVYDLGAGHSSAAESLTSRILSLLKSEGLLNESVGAGYIERNWPPALQETGAWPLSSLRQSFLNGSLTRLVDPDRILKQKIWEFVQRGDFGLASGKKPDETYIRIWFHEHIDPDEIEFNSQVFLLKKEKAKSLKEKLEIEEEVQENVKIKITEEIFETGETQGQKVTAGETEKVVSDTKQLLILKGAIPPEIWNRFGTKIIPKLKSAQSELQISIEINLKIDSKLHNTVHSEISQLLDELGLKDIKIL